MASLLVRPAFLVALLLLASTPNAAAEADPRIHEDAAVCLQALGATVEGTDDQTTTCVVAYAHPREELRFHIALNAQRPPDETSAWTGFQQPTLQPHWDLATWTFDLHQGMVDYRESGIIYANPAFDGPLALDAETPIQVRLHFSVDQVPRLAPSAPEATPAGAAPCVAFEVRLVTSPSYDGPEEVLTQGRGLAHLVNPGITPPELPCDGGPYAVPDETGITALDLTLPAPARSLEGRERPRLIVTAANAEANGDDATLGGIHLVQDADHINHVVFAVHEAIRIDEILSAWSDDRLYVRTDVRSPWGDYDVSHEGLDLQLLAPDGTLLTARSTGQLADPQVRYEVAHDRPDQPVRALFDLGDLPLHLADGTYTLRATATNGQYTARTTTEVPLLLSAGGTLLTTTTLNGTSTVYRIAESEESPLPLLPWALTLGLLLAAQHRRR